MAQLRSAAQLRAIALTPYLYTPPFLPSANYVYYLRRAVANPTRRSLESAFLRGPYALLNSPLPSLSRVMLRHIQRWTIPGPRNRVKPLLYWMAVIHELNQLPLNQEAKRWLRLVPYPVDEDELKLKTRFRKACQDFLTGYRNPVVRSGVFGSEF